MTEYENIIKILTNAKNECLFLMGGGCIDCSHKGKANCTIEHFAQYLLRHGVTALSCDAGDKVYAILDYDWGIGEQKIAEYEIYNVSLNKTDHTQIRYAAQCRSHDLDDIWFYEDDVGKTIFLSYEEAEKELELIK